MPSPSIEERQDLGPGHQVVTLAGLVRMKLASNRDVHRVHLRDMINVDLIGRDLLKDLTDELQDRLEALLAESGR